MRGTPELDFRQLFLVKESLALMYQMMQLPQDSLVQYEELEALLSFASLASLPTNEWPLTPIDFGNLSKKSKSSKLSRDSTHGDDLPEASSLPVEQDSSVNTLAVSPQSQPQPQPWMNAYQHGTSILMYSINYTRMKVLKNKVSINELTHYVFARQAFFLFSLGKISLCTEKGFKFISIMYSTLIKKLEDVKRGSAIDNLKLAVLGRYSITSSDSLQHTALPPHTANSIHGSHGNGTGTGNGTGNEIPIVHMAGKSTTLGGLHASQLNGGGAAAPAPGGGAAQGGGTGAAQGGGTGAAQGGGTGAGAGGSELPNNTKDKLKEIAILIGLWAVIASVQLVKGCRDQFHLALTSPSSSAHHSTAADLSTASPVFLRSRTISGGATTGLSFSASSLSQSNVLDASSPPTASSSGKHSTAAATVLPSAIHESLATKIRDASRYLSDILFFAKDILLEIFQYQHSLALSLRPSGSLSGRPLLLYDEYRRLSLEVARDFSGWVQFDELIQKHPDIFMRPSSQSDDDLLPSVLASPSGAKDRAAAAAAGAAGGSELKKTPTPRDIFIANNNKQKLFGETIENLEEVFSFPSFPPSFIPHLSCLCSLLCFALLLFALDHWELQPQTDQVH
jgi:hypothetical protein